MLFTPACRLVLLRHLHLILSFLVVRLLKREAFLHRFTPLVSPSLLLWHDRGGIRQAAISEAASDLCNLPGPRLHTERELKRSLIVVGIAVGSDGLEQQEPGCRHIAHLIHATVDNRDASGWRWQRCPLLLQCLCVLFPGRIQILSV